MNNDELEMHRRVLKGMLGTNDAWIDIWNERSICLDGSFDADELEIISKYMRALASSQPS